jgi:putative tryptophan/tyrosine transport system substrate-binding protein
MKRRQFLHGLGAVAMGLPGKAAAQKAPPRIGFLASGAAASIGSEQQVRALKRGLEANGLLEDRDYVFEPRFAGGRDARFPEMARELAALGVSVILAGTVASVRAAQSLAPSVPVVMLSIDDPVGVGLIAGLASPGGATTGTATLDAALIPELLELQRELFPKATSIAVLTHPANPANQAYVSDLRHRARERGLSVTGVEVGSRDELEAAFAALPAQRADLLHVISDSDLLDLSDRIAALALMHRLPTFSTVADFTRFGGLLGYGPWREKLTLRAAWYLKRILEGTAPADLAVEQAATPELWINLRTAKALGLPMPASLLASADEVIK